MADFEEIINTRRSIREYDSKEVEDEKIEVLSEQEKSLLESFRKLPPKKQKALIDLL